MKTLVSIDLQTHTTKAMGPLQNRISTVDTINNVYKDFLCIYTDGYKAVDNSTGAAFHVPAREVTSKWRLQDTSSIVSAELSALKKATNWLLHQNQPCKTVILTDSKCSLYLLLHRKPKVFAGVIQTIHENVLKLNDKGWQVVFQWIPSHCDFQPNDHVDEAANQARILPNVTYRSVELVDLQRLVKCRQAVMWQSLWDVEKQGTFLGTIKDNLGDWDWCRIANRALDMTMTRFRLGKVGLNKYLKDIQK